VQLGFENKKKMIWAAVLGGLAVVTVAYEIIPMLSGPSVTASTAAAPAPVLSRTSSRGAATKLGKKKQHVENLDPTLRLDLLAMSEQTQYEGNGRNIFVSQPDVVIPVPKGTGAIGGAEEPKPWTPPPTPSAPPIPLKFFGFANEPGEPKKIFLSQGDDVFVAGEGEIVDRRYKVVHITPTSVELQDVLNSGPPQNIPLTQG